MVHFSSIYTPAQMRHGAVFSARQYPRQAFDNLIDPILNVDWFDMSGPTFPPHPHAGFSAVTYLFADSPNGFVNRDSFGAEHSPRRPALEQGVSRDDARRNTGSWCGPGARAADFRQPARDRSGRSRRCLRGSGGGGQEQIGQRLAKPRRLR